MKKRLLALLLAAIMLLGMIPLASAAEPEAVLPAAQSAEDASPAIQASETALPAELAVTYTLNGEKKTADLVKIGTSTFQTSGFPSAEHDVLLASLPNGAENVAVTAPADWKIANYYGKTPSAYGNFVQPDQSDYMEDADFIDEKNLQTTQYGTYGFGEYIRALNDETKAKIPTQNVTGFFVMYGKMPNMSFTECVHIFVQISTSDGTNFTDEMKSGLKALLDRVADNQTEFYTTGDHWNGKTYSKTGFWAELTAAGGLREKATKLYANPGSMARYNAMVQSMTDAVATLIPTSRANTSDLYDALEAAKLITEPEKIYTDASVAAFNTAKAAAQTLMDSLFGADGAPTTANSNQKQTDVDTKAKALTDAIAGLTEDLSKPWDGERYDVSWYDAAGTTFTISNYTQLAGLARLANGTAEGVTSAVNFRNKTITLAADINLGGQTWTSIAASGKEFCGTFDGQGHTIRGLAGSALFGTLGSDGTVKNLSVDGKIEGNSTAALIWKMNPASKLLNCINRASVIGPAAAGLVYQTSGNRWAPQQAVISGCANYGAVTATDNQATGIVLIHNYALIYNCYNVGAINGKDAAAGISWQHSGNVQNCYNAGTLTSEGKRGAITYEGKTGSGNYYLAADGLTGSTNTSAGDDFAKGLTAAELQALAPTLGWPFAADDGSTKLNSGYPVFEYQKTGTYKDETEGLTLTGLTAVNGTLTCTFDRTLSYTTLTAADFTVTYKTGDSEATTVTPTKVAMDGRTVVLTVPAISTGTSELTYTYSVAYRSGSPKTTKLVVSGFTITSPEATNGTFTGTVAAGTTVTKADFTAYVSIDGGEEQELTLKAVRVNGITLSATFDKYNNDAVSHTYRISIQYKGGTKYSDEFTVGAVALTSIDSFTAPSRIFGQVTANDVAAVVELTLSEKPVVTPTKEDFIGYYTVSGSQTQVPVTFTRITPSSTKITLQFAPIALTDKEQTVTLYVGYKTGERKASQPVTLPAQRNWSSFGEKPKVGDGSQSSPYQIGTAEELAWFAALVNGDLTDGTKQNRAAYADLTADIALNDTANWTSWTAETKDLRVWKPIGIEDTDSSGAGFGYSGVFDGHGHTISGLYLPYRDAAGASYYSRWLGLFGQVEGTVKNVRLEKSLIDVGSNSIVQCGGIAAEVLYGQILNCSTDFRATVNATSGNTNRLGGIVGNIAYLDNSSAGIKGCASTAALTGEARTNIGGIAGATANSFKANALKITDCYFNGSITNKAAFPVYGIAPGRVYTDSKYIDGAVVTKRYSTLQIQNCYAAGTYTLNGGKLYAITNAVDNNSKPADTDLKTSFINNHYLANDAALNDFGATAHTEAEFKAAEMPITLGSAYDTDSKSINGGYPVLLWQNSKEGAAERTEAPLFTLTGGGLTGKITVAISCATENATILYTTDGSVPTVGHGTVYTAPFTLEGTVRAVAWVNGMQLSLVNSTSVTTAMAPTATPAARTLTEAADITLATATKGATIYYTTDGSAVVTGSAAAGYTLSETAKTYTAAIHVDKPCTIQAVAAAEGKLLSAVMTQRYDFGWSAEAPEGTGTAADPYKIGTPAQLAWFASVVNGTQTGAEKNAAACAKLTADIDMGAYTYTPMETFSGTFDGNGHTIRNLYFGNDNGPGYEDPHVSMALVRTNTGTIKDLTFAGRDMDILSGHMAPIAIENQGTISNCKNTVNVYSSSGVAGIAVHNDTTGVIEFCANTGTIGTLHYAYGFRGKYSLGGISAKNDGIIRDCYNTGEIATAPLTNGSAGQIAGYTTNGSTVLRCYALGNISNWGTRQEDASNWGGWSGQHPYNDKIYFGKTGKLAGGVIDEMDFSSTAVVKDSYFIPHLTLNGDQLKSVSLTDCFRANYQPRMQLEGGGISAGFGGRSLAYDKNATSVLKTGVTYYAFYDATNETYLALELSGTPSSSTTATVDAAKAESKPQVKGKAGHYTDSSAANGYSATFSIYQIPSNTKTVKFLNTDKLQVYSMEADLTDYRAAQLTPETKDAVLTQVKSTWQAAYSEISDALRYIDTNAEQTDFEGGAVTVIIENTTFTSASQSKTGSDEPAWTGTLVNRKVELTDGMTMMQAILAAAEKGSTSGQPVTIIGAENNYISSINGLAQFHGKGAHSGWMGTLDGWFVSSGFGGFSTKDGSLRDGSIIRVMYTNSDNGGSDIGGAIEGDTNTKLKALSFTNGTLAPDFAGTTTTYTLTLDPGAAETTVSYTAANAVFQARAYVNKLKPNQWGYRSGETMPVQAGDTIYVLVGYDGWSSMQSGATQTLYTITVPGTETPSSTYTVTFDAQGGSSVTAQKVLKNAAAVEPKDPTRTGYSFSGWYLEPACTTAWNFALPVTGDMTLYAGWIEKADDASYKNTLTAVLKYVKDNAGENPGYTFDGNAGGEWAVLAEARGGVEARGWYATYLQNMAQTVAANKGKFDTTPGQSKHTEYSRVVLALTAAGANASKFKAADGSTYDLVKPLLDACTSGRYAYQASVQGSNGTAFALIALDSGSYHQNAAGRAARTALVDLLLKKQMSCGAWGINYETEERSADIDITAMVVQSLAPYASRPGVQTAINNAMDWLSAKFKAGSFRSSETSAQVVVALSTLGHDAATDPAFVKANGVSVLDDLLHYADKTTGGFLHDVGSVNGMSSEQAAYALVSYDRYRKGKTSLYDMSDVIAAEPGTAESVEKLIEAIIANGVTESSYDALTEARLAYNDLSNEEKAKVSNLSDLENAEARYDALLKAKQTEAIQALTKHYESLDLKKYSKSAQQKLKDILQQAQSSIRSAKSCEQVTLLQNKAITDMNAVKTGEITVTFRLIGALQATQDVNLTSSTYLPEYVTWVPTTTYTLQENATVYELFTKAMGDAGLRYVGAENNYVSTIYAPSCLGGYALSEFTNGTRSGWMYTVNGSHPNQGLKYWTLKDGDVVVWHYINDYSHEVADWFNDPKYPSLGNGTYYNDWLRAADISPEQYVQQLLGKILKVGKNGTVEPKLTLSHIGRSVTFTFKPDKGYHVKDVKVDGKSVGAVTTYTVDKLTVSTRIEVEFTNGVLPFTDVREADWFYDDVVYAYENGLFSGTSDTTFSPNASMTRAMLVTVLYRLEGQPTVSGRSGFSDVKLNSYYEDAVTWAADNGIVNGTGATTFSPNANVTREQMAAILYRYAQYKQYGTTASASLNGFSDAAKVSAYAKAPLSWAVAEKLVNGSEGRLLPTGNATRAQVAAILHRFVENVAKTTA
ncbi:MAG: S-layer homology domain-containing protein [Oscillospiraceae bacterium]